MNIATLTASIAALSDRTRHIVAGIVAYKLTDDTPAFAPLWDLCRDHGQHYDWPTTRELALALSDCGLSRRAFARELAVYDSYGDAVSTADPIAHHYGSIYTTDSDRVARRGAVDKRYEWSGGEV